MSSVITMRNDSGKGIVIGVFDDFCDAKIALFEALSHLSENDRAILEDQTPASLKVSVFSSGDKPSRIFRIDPVKDNEILLGDAIFI